MALRIGSRAAVRATGAAVAAALAFGAAGGLTFASFTGAASSAGPTLTTKRVFSGTRTTPAWSIDDRSAGGPTAVDTSGELAYADATTPRTITTSNKWPAAFGAARYHEFRMNSALPGGIPVTGAAFNFSYATTGATTAFFYFDVRDAATGTVVLGTHGSSLAPVGSASTTLTTFSTPLPELTNSDLVNGVRIRVYQWTPGTTSKTETDLATVSGAGYAPFVMYPASYADASSGTAAVAPWDLVAAGDGFDYQSVNGWAASYPAVGTPTRFIELAFPAYVPAGAAITKVDFTHTFKDLGGVQQCYYFDVIVAGAVIGTHDKAAPTCSAGAAYRTVVSTLAEVDTVAEANAVVVRMYGMNTGGGSKKSLDDTAVLSVTYSLT